MFHREVFDFKYLNLFLNILNKNRIEFLVLMGRICWICSMGKSNYSIAFEESLEIVCEMLDIVSVVSCRVFFDNLL